MFNENVETFHNHLGNDKISNDHENITINNNPYIDEKNSTIKYPSSSDNINSLHKVSNTHNQFHILIQDQANQLDNQPLSEVPDQEPKSSIFNSKNMMNFIMKKSELQTFYDQNNDLRKNSDENQIILTNDDKLAGPNKSKIPNEKTKRKKNSNYLKCQIDGPVIMEKNPKYDELPIKHEEENKFPYKSLNKEKEEKFEKHCEQISKQINNKSTSKKIIKINDRETEAQNTHVNTLLNNFTKDFFYSNNHSDIVQSSLEYNNYLINQLITNKSNLPKSEFEHGLIILWENLKKLSKNAETHIKFFPLRNDSKYNEIYTTFLQNVEYLNNKKDNNESVYDESGVNMDNLSKKRLRNDYNSNDFNIVIDKAILKEFPLK